MVLVRAETDSPSFPRSCAGFVILQLASSTEEIRGPTVIDVVEGVLVGLLDLVHVGDWSASEGTPIIGSHGSLAKLHKAEVILSGPFTVERRL